MSTENQGEKRPALEFIEALIEGGLSEDGFYKVTTGVASQKKWFVLIHESAIRKVTEPEVDPDYKSLGSLQKIYLETQGVWKRDENSNEQPINEFFDLLRDDKPSTVSPTKVYKFL